MSISTNYSVKIDDKNYTLNLNEVPKISESTIKIFREHKHFLGIVPMDLVAQDLEVLSERLEYAKDHPIKDKLFALLRSLLSVAIIGAGVFGGALTGFPILCSFAAAIIYLHNSYHNAIVENYKVRENIYDLFMLIIGGPVFPLIGLIGKEERYSNAIAIECVIVDMTVRERFNLFNSNLDDIKKELKDDIELPGKKDTFEFNLALTEIQQNVEFYTKLKAT